MAEFTTVNSYDDFQRTVKSQARYIHNDEVRSFLATVLETSTSRSNVIEKGSVFWRAQRGYTWRRYKVGDEEELDQDAFESERMVPNAALVGDGRINPRGIPCLYLASTKETAMAEVRPWLGSFISVAQFKVMRDLKIVDCSKDKHDFGWQFVFNKDGDLIPRSTTPEERERIVWGNIGYAFSRPITQDEAATEYVPTQILAEAFRAHGYDGIVYKSLLEKGFNIALFDCKAAELINCCLYSTELISFQFEQCGNPYFVPKHYPQLQKESQQNREPSNSAPKEKPQTEITAIPRNEADCQ